MTESDQRSIKEDKEMRVENNKLHWKRESPKIIVQCIIERGNKKIVDHFEEKKIANKVFWVNSFGWLKWSVKIVSIRNIKSDEVRIVSSFNLKDKVKTHLLCLRLST